VSSRYRLGFNHGRKSVVNAGGVVGRGVGHSSGLETVAQGGSRASPKWEQFSFFSSGEQAASIGVGLAGLGGRDKLVLQGPVGGRSCQELIPGQN
jgi:hypothetical protein